MWCTAPTTGSSCSGWWSSRLLQGVPALLTPVVHVADAGTGAQAHAEADRRQHDAAALLVVDTRAADVVEAAVDAGVALEDVVHRGQVVDEHEYLRRVAAQVEADRRTGPEHARAAAALHRQLAVAIAQTHADRAGDFLALDVGVRPALVLEGLLDHLGQAL